MINTTVRDISNPIKFYHIRNVFNSNEVCTVATRVNETNMDVGFAFCSKKDRFNRKVGRDIAFSRLDKPHNQHIITDFSGNSAMDVKRIWEAVDKPSSWKNVKTDWLFEFC